jgi:hypothetical protein
MDARIPYFLLSCGFMETIVCACLPASNNNRCESPAFSVRPFCSARRSIDSRPKSARISDSRARGKRRCFSCRYASCLAYCAFFLFSHSSHSSIDHSKHVHTQAWAWAFRHGAFPSFLRVFDELKAEGVVFPDDPDAPQPPSASSSKSGSGSSGVAKGKGFALSSAVPAPARASQPSQQQPQIQQQQQQQQQQQRAAAAVSNASQQYAAMLPSCLDELLVWGVPLIFGFCLACF